MNYLVSKRDLKYEYRIYIDSGEEIDGTLIFKGHKLQPDPSLLSRILEWKVEKSTGKFYFLKYNNVYSDINHLDSKLWNVSGVDSFDKMIQESWDSLLKKMTVDFGSFRKILVTENNI